MIPQEFLYYLLPTGLIVLAIGCSASVIFLTQLFISFIKSIAKRIFLVKYFDPPNWAKVLFSIIASIIIGIITLKTVPIDMIVTTKIYISFIFVICAFANGWVTYENAKIKKLKTIIK